MDNSTTDLTTYFLGISNFLSIEVGRVKYYQDGLRGAYPNGDHNIKAQLFRKLHDADK